VTQDGLLNHTLKNIQQENNMSNDESNTNTLRLSNQALGSVMMALQESLLNELDIVPILKSFELVQSEDGLVVTNPPTVRVSNEKQITEQDLLNMVE
jgi:hypothetical protein